MSRVKSWLPPPRGFEAGITAGFNAGYAEARRQAASVSPPLAQMVGRARQRLSQLFEAVLAMSQRLQFELQRWHSQWGDLNNNLRESESAKAALELRATQLQERVASLGTFLEEEKASKREAEAERDMLRSEKKSWSKERRKMVGTHTKLREQISALKVKLAQVRHQQYPRS